MATTTPTRLLVVTDRTAFTPELLEAIRARAGDGAVKARILVPNPAPAEWHPTHPERHLKAQQVLEDALPHVSEAAGVNVDGFVSTRHDPMDAIEELLHDEPVDELIIATAPHHVESWLHVDLPHRAAHLGLPVIAVTATAAKPMPRHAAACSLGRRMMTDGYNIALTTSTPIFAVILASVFAVWWGVERTLSIHTIFTTRREAFYWLAILFTVALGHRGR